MRIHTKLLALLIVALTFGIFASAASANRLSISETDFDVIWPETSDLNFTAGGNTVECSVTLLGSFHSRTIRKVAGLLIGAVRHARIGDCDNGTAIIDVNPPWVVRYTNFTGTLPNLTGATLTLTGQRFTINHEGSGATCITVANSPANGRVEIGAGGVVTGLTALGAPTIPIDDVGASFLCDLAGTGAFSGTGNVTDLEGDTLTVRLI
ncbi:MAG TPA: hypothetical protein VK509_04760 [Polyangiales bacterium]|nr:hypothetical protein [Polyangiales bacterium]